MASKEKEHEIKEEYKGNKKLAYTTFSKNHHNSQIIYSTGKSI